ncbi:MAG: hypothetical protein JST81_03335 [Bacteroidetes bacterium]|nr:hypothetical protein [Bacteroidota bacterium]
MKRLQFTVVLFLMAIGMSASAQKMKLKDGSLDAIKNETSFNFEFTYDNMAVGKFDKEADYVQKKVHDYNEKSEGKGDAWAKRWVSDRELEFEPKFREMFNKYMESTTKKDAKYTIIFHTIFTEPGYNTGMGMIGGKKAAQIDAEVTIVETADHSKKIATITIDNAPGSSFFGADIDTGARIAECYAKAGKSLAKFIK